MFTIKCDAVDYVINTVLLHRGLIKRNTFACVHSIDSCKSNM